MTDNPIDLHESGQPHHPEGCGRCAIVDGHDTLPDTKWGHLDRILDRMEERVRNAAWKWDTAWSEFEVVMNQTPEETERMHQALRDLPNRLEG